MDAGSPPPTGAGFRPSLGLRSAAMQSTLASKRPVQRIWRRRGIDLNTLSSARVLDCRQGAKLSGRLTPRRDNVAARGLVVLIHGWAGCHDSSYLYATAARLHHEGYDVFRLNLRDHGGTHHLNREMFHSARMGEVLDAVQGARRLVADGPLHIVGFSLGGNFALRIALLGPAAGITPALTIAVSPSINPGATLQAIDSGPRLIRWYFLDKWRKTLQIKREAWPHYDFSAYARLDSFVAVTRQFVADFTEYPSCEAYLAEYTLTPQMLMNAPSPIAIISAADDSVIPLRDFQGLAVQGSVVAADLTKYGGHCGFIADWRMSSWAETRIVHWLDTLCR